MFTVISCKNLEECCSFSVAQSCLTLCNPMDCSTWGFPLLHHLLELDKSHVHGVGNANQSSHLFSLPFSFCLQSSQASRSFPMSYLCTRWQKCWSFSFSIIPSNEYSGLISFMMDWLDLFVVQGTSKSLLQQHSSTASFFGAQPSLWSNCHICSWLLKKL